MFTDIHFGKKGNSDQHNQDCLNYIQWFCDQVTLNSCDSIVFGGDWFETRDSISIKTLDFSNKGMALLDQLGIPVYFIIGNHDLYLKTSRDIFSPVIFSKFENIILVDQPIIIDELGDGTFLCPYLTESDQAEILMQYTNIPLWIGHFEFPGFLLTNETALTSEHSNQFKQVSLILSGHFHKRQRQDNIYYIGNTFPMSFADSWDSQRGCAIIDHNNLNVLKMIDWPECPMYITLKLSDIVSGNFDDVPKHSRLKILVDVQITHDEHLKYRQSFNNKYSLREYSPVETEELLDLMRGDDEYIDINVVDGSSPEQKIVEMLNNISSDKIQTKMLVRIFENLI